MEFRLQQVYRNEPVAFHRKLADEDEKVVTVDGKPFTVMINLAEIEHMDDILLPGFPLAGPKWLHALFVVRISTMGWTR